MIPPSLMHTNHTERGKRERRRVSLMDKHRSSTRTHPMHIKHLFTKLMCFLGRVRSLRCSGSRPDSSMFGGFESKHTDQSK